MRDAAFTVLLALAIAGGLAPAMTLAEPARFVHDEPDGRLRNGVRYAIRLEEVRRSDDTLVLRVIQRAGPRQARRAVSFRAVCAYMAAQGKKIAEIRAPDSERDTLVVHFPAALSQAELDDEGRHFFTETLCLKLAAGTP